MYQVLKKQAYKERNLIHFRNIIGIRAFESGFFLELFEKYFTVNSNPKT